MKWLDRSAALLTVAVLILSLVAPLGAATPTTVPNDARGLPLWQVRTWDDAPVRLVLADLDAVQRLLAAVPVGAFDREDLHPDPAGWILETRVTPTEAAALRAAGYVFTRLSDREQAGRRAAERDWASRHQNGKPAPALNKSDAPALTTYPTHAEIGSMLSTLATNHPDICRTFNWGQSVLGRELWGLVVSADVDNTTAEPEVRLSSTMHGNEVVGMVMLVNLAHHLVLNYGEPGYADLTSLVDNTEIHLMPLHNPDGYISGVRLNANGVDLNRNFPLPAGTQPVREIENLNFMAYANAHHFVVSANGHGGALVMNYPWDYTYTLAPDDAALIQLSLEYSTYNLPMYNGPFLQGITNGAAWYVATGTLQDWSYDQTDCIDVTAELGYTKWPAASLLAGIWDDNRESLLHYAAAVHYGVNGVVSDSLSGAGLDATVTVTGNPKSVSTDPAHGDYYKLLATGTYELSFSAEGYRSKTIAGVSTTWGTPTVLDVQLAPLTTSVPPAAYAGLALTAWPNPFNPGTKLTVTVPAEGPVQLSVYDLSGRRIRSLLARSLVAGDHPVSWDGRDDRGTQVPSGVYFARALTATGGATAKLLLVK
jgi:hypothetical protein